MLCVQRTRKHDERECGSYDVSESRVRTCVRLQLQFASSLFITIYAMHAGAQCSRSAFAFRHQNEQITTIVICNNDWDLE